MGIPDHCRHIERAAEGNLDNAILAHIRDYRNVPIGQNVPMTIWAKCLLHTIYTGLTH